MYRWYYMKKKVSTVHDVLAALDNIIMIKIKTLSGFFFENIKPTQPYPICMYNVWYIIIRVSKPDSISTFKK